MMTTVRLWSAVVAKHLDGKFLLILVCKREDVMCGRLTLLALALGLPVGGFRGNQGAVAVNDVGGSAGNGAFCVLSSER